MRKLLLIALFIFPQIIFAQSFRKKLEVGLALGTTHYLGNIGGNLWITKDLGPISDIQYGQFGICLAALGRYQFSKYLAVRANLTYGKAKGADSLCPRIGNHDRNLSFATSYYEINSTLEFPLIFSNGAISRYVKSRRNKSESKFYGFVGLGFMYFNPTATYGGAVYSLEPLHTEGTGYSQYTLTIPMGLGYSYSWSKKYKLALELGFRKTFTQHFDDVHDKYASPAEIKAGAAPGLEDVAVALANRSDPKGELASAYYPGEKRGNPNTHAFVITTTVNFYYTFSAKRRSHRAKF
jgi:hypothetical protein